MKRPFVRGPTTPFRGLTITMVANYLLNGMILQVGGGLGKVFFSQPPKTGEQRWHSIESWLVNRDSYNGLLQSPYNWVVFHPLYTANNQGFGHCSGERPVFFCCFKILNLTGWWFSVRITSKYYLDLLFGSSSNWWIILAHLLPLSGSRNFEDEISTLWRKLHPKMDWS